MVGHYHEFVYPDARGKMLQREYLAPDYFSNRKEARGEAVCSLANNLGKGAHAFTFFKCEHVEPRSAVVVPVGSEAKLRHAQSILGGLGFKRIVVSGYLGYRAGHSADYTIR